MGIKTGCSQDLTGKVAIVTGCNTGIGLQTAKMLCSAGAHVIMACRYYRGESSPFNRQVELAAPDKSQQQPDTFSPILRLFFILRSVERAGGAKAEVMKDGGKADVMALDLSDVKSIQSFAKQFSSSHKQLDILVNNAGLNTISNYKGPRVTAQDYEICMGTNYFGHFMLTALLMPALMAAPEARVVALSSVTTWFASNKYQFYVKGESKTKGNYAASKLACLAMTMELQRKLDAKFPDNKVYFTAADPGFVASDIWRNYNVVFRKIAGMLALTTAEGAMTSVNAASLQSVKKGALYMPFWIRMSKIFKFNKKIAYDLGMPLLTRPFAGFSADSPAPKAKDAKSTSLLWDLSTDFCKDNGMPSSAVIFTL